MARPSMGFDRDFDVICDALHWDLCPSPSPLHAPCLFRRDMSFPRNLSPRTRKARIQDVAETTVTVACHGSPIDGFR